MPLVETIRAHVFAAERIHADDTTVPVLAKGKTRTGRLWTYVRDDQAFGGPDPPAAAFFYSPDRGGEHPEQHLASYAGLMQADAYAASTGSTRRAASRGPLSRRHAGRMRGARASRAHRPRSFHKEIKGLAILSALALAEMLDAMLDVFGRAVAATIGTPYFPTA
jgi:Transposase IS66 family